MTRKANLTAAQRAQLVRAFRLPRGVWLRSTTAGERVTLASLASRGLLVRRAWRGDGVSRDSAFEYQLADALRAALERAARPAQARYEAALSPVLEAELRGARCA